MNTVFPLARGTESLSALTVLALAFLYLNHLSWPCPIVALRGWKVAAVAVPRGQTTAPDATFVSGLGWGQRIFPLRRVAAVTFLL